MNVKLFIQRGGKKNRVIQLRSDETIVGRRQDCDLRIQSAAVSRRHCLLRFQDDALTVEDLDSINGTFVNGKRVNGKQFIRPGDRLEIGPVCFRVDYKPSGRGRADTVALAEEEEVDVLPLAEADLDDLEPVELEAVESETELSVNPSASLLEALEVSEDIENNAEWHLPENDELRNILSDMDMDDPNNKLK